MGTACAALRIRRSGVRITLGALRNRLDYSARTPTSPRFVMTDDDRCRRVGTRRDAFGWRQIGDSRQGAVFAARRERLSCAPTPLRRRVIIAPWASGSTAIGVKDARVLSRRTAGDAGRAQSGF